MKRLVFLMVGLVLGIGLTFGFARFMYKPVTQTNSLDTEDSMQMYIEKQKQTLTSLDSNGFDAKASQQIEQFMSDAITMTDTAKNTPRHPELQNFATDSTYSLAFNREGVRIIQEDLGLRPKHEGKHCDSVGSC